MPGVGVGVGVGKTTMGTLLNYILKNETSVGGFSLRLLTTDYMGNAIKVRRSNDNAELDIPFLGNWLDTAVLLTFVGSNSAFVTTWYDQSGNGNNAVQTTNAVQPLIVDAGALITVNGKPAIRFNGTSQYMIADSIAPTFNGANKLTSVLCLGNTTIDKNAFEEIVSGSSSADTGFMLRPISFTDTSRYVSYQRDSVAGTVKEKISSYVRINTQFIYTTYRGTNQNTYVNGDNVLNVDNISTTISLNRFTIGALRRSSITNYFKGELQELIIFPSNKLVDRVKLESNIKSAYSVSYGALDYFVLDKYLNYNKIAITEAGFTSYFGLSAGTDYSPRIHLRDLAMTIDNVPEWFTANNLNGIYLWFKSHVNTATGDYIMVNSMTADATTIFRNYILDNKMYFVSIAYNYYLKSLDSSFLTDEITYLKAVLDSVFVSGNGLVLKDERTESGWGFYDVVNMTGELLFCSVLHWRAYMQLAEMALSINSTAIYNDCIAKAANIKTQINSTFYVADSGKYYMKASTLLCSGQFDLPGTCLALTLGIIDSDKAELITTYINSIINDCEQDGAMIFVPPTHHYNPGVAAWESMTAVKTYGTYQNGGYWLTPVNWLIEVIKDVNPSKAAEMMSKSFIKGGSSSWTEWWNTTVGATIGSLKYSLSVSAYYKSKKLL